jgi:hypothetical protein
MGGRKNGWRREKGGQGYEDSGIQGYCKKKDTEENYPPALPRGDIPQAFLKYPRTPESPYPAKFYVALL